MKALLHIHSYIRLFRLVSPLNKEDETPIRDFFLNSLYLIVIFSGVIIPTFALLIDESTSANDAINTSLLFVAASTGVVLIIGLRSAKDETTDIFATIQKLNEESKYEFIFNFSRQIIQKMCEQLKIHNWKEFWQKLKKNVKIFENQFFIFG